MLSVHEALLAVFDRSTVLAPRSVACDRALGLILAEDVTADLDAPPFDKAIVDGYAVRTANLIGTSHRLRVGEEITAGKIPSRPLEPGEAAAIMTGAPVPAGADAVVMVERTLREGSFVIIQGGIVTGQNLLPRGRETRAGDTVLAAGEVLTPVRLGLLATVGRTEVRVQPPPRVAIVATGDELVEPSQLPGPGQIRNSNAPMLRALAVSAGVEAVVLPIAPDEPDALKAILARGLDADVLLVSGGVSAGTRDLVPAALAALGVENVFHKVNIKPGKPLWFGVGPPRSAVRPKTLVFGLPGNPVSTLVAFLVFVRPALARLAGGKGTDSTRQGRLANPFSQTGSRPCYVPARWSVQAGECGEVTLLKSAGSGDLRTVAGADGFAFFEAGVRRYDAGEIVPFLPLG